MTGIAVGTLLATAYGVVLAIIAVSVDALARRAERRADPLDSEQRRFIHGIAVGFVASGAVVMCGVGILNHGAADLLTLSTGLLVLLAAGVHLLADLRTAPSARGAPAAGRSEAAALDR